MKTAQLRKPEDQSTDFQNPRKSQAGMVAACNLSTWGRSKTNKNQTKQTNNLNRRPDALVSLVGSAIRHSGPASRCSKRPFLNKVQINGRKCSVSTCGL